MIDDEQRISIGWAARAISGVARLFAAAALSYVFVVVLMTASAQSMVAAKLNGKDYSSAFARIAVADRAAGRLGEASSRARQLQRTADKLKETNDQAESKFRDAASSLERLMDELIDAKSCSLPDPRKDSYALRPGTVAGILDQLRQCALERRSLSPETRLQITTVSGQRDELVALGKDWLNAFNTSQLADRDAKEARGEVEALIFERDGAKDVRADFAPILLMKDRPILGGSALVQFPPTMMQIVMAFFSGTFGALLVALVLIVYPSAKLNLTTPGGNYGERILLGGLIAVCVYIVLGGGSAVLGSANAFSDGSANYQAFSAIGVLAGMFSDRVAQWLSARADTLYGSNSRAAVDSTVHAEGAAGRLHRAGLSDARPRAATEDSVP